MNDVKISLISAAVADRAAVDQLLEGIPFSHEIGASIYRPYFARRWDPSCECSFWISSDGTTMVRLAVTGLNVDETIAIWIGYDDCRLRDGFELSATGLREIIRSELDVHAELER